MTNQTIAVAAIAVCAVSADKIIGDTPSFVTKSRPALIMPPELGTTPTTSSQNVEALATRAERDQLILQYLPLVRTIATYVQARLPVNVDLDDLVQSGVFGLFAAAKNFNPDRKAAFGSYARHRINGAMLDSLRQLDPSSREMRKRQKQVRTATMELTGILQRAPTEDEIAAHLGVTVERLRVIMLDMPARLFSASSRLSKDDELPEPEFPAKIETQPNSIFASIELRTILEKAIQTLPPRYQSVVALYYSSELKMREIGKVLGINQSRVSQIRKAAIKRMEVVLQTLGISSIGAFLN